MKAWQTPKFRLALRVTIIIALELFLFLNISPQSDFSIPLQEDHGLRPWVGGALHHHGGSGRRPTRGVKVLGDHVHARGAPVEGCFPKKQACARLSLLYGNYPSNPKEAPLNAPSSMSHRERALHRDSPSGVLDALRQGLSPFKGIAFNPLNNPQVIAHNFTVGNDCTVNNALVSPLKLGKQGDKFYISLIRILELYSQGGNVDDVRSKLEAGFPKGVFEWEDAELEGIEGLVFRLKFGEERRYSLVDKDGTITITRIDITPNKVELVNSIQVSSTQGVAVAPDAKTATPKGISLLSSLEGPLSVFLEWIREVAYSLDNALSLEELRSILVRKFEVEGVSSKESKGIIRNLPKLYERAIKRAEAALAFIREVPKDGKLNVYIMRDAWLLYEAHSLIRSDKACAVYFSKDFVNMNVYVLVGELINSLTMEITNTDTGTFLKRLNEDNPVRLDSEQYEEFKRRFFVEFAQLARENKDVREFIIKVLNYLDAENLIEEFSSGVRFIDTTMVGTMPLLLEAVLHLPLVELRLRYENLKIETETLMYYSRLSEAISFEQNMSKARATESLTHPIKHMGIKDNVPYFGDTSLADRITAFIEAIVLKSVVLQQQQVIEPAQLTSHPTLPDLFENVGLPSTLNPYYQPRQVTGVILPKEEFYQSIREDGKFKGAVSGGAQGHWDIVAQVGGQYLVSIEEYLEHVGTVARRKGIIVRIRHVEDAGLTIVAELRVPSDWLIIRGVNKIYTDGAEFISRVAEALRAGKTPEEALNFVVQQDSTAESGKPFQLSASITAPAPAAAPDAKPIDIQPKRPELP